VFAVSKTGMVVCQDCMFKKIFTCAGLSLLVWLAAIFTLCIYGGCSSDPSSYLLSLLGFLATGTVVGLLLSSYTYRKTSEILLLIPESIVLIFYSVITSISFMPLKSDNELDYYLIAIVAFTSFLGMKYSQSLFGDMKIYTKLIITIMYVIVLIATSVFIMVIFWPIIFILLALYISVLSLGWFIIVRIRNENKL